MEDRDFLVLISKLSGYGLSHVEIMFNFVGKSKEKVKTLVYLMKNNWMDDIERPETSGEALTLLATLKMPQEKVFSFFEESSPEFPVYDPKIKI